MLNVAKVNGKVYTNLVNNCTAINIDFCARAGRFYSNKERLKIVRSDSKLTLMLHELSVLLVQAFIRAHIRILQGLI